MALRRRYNRTKKVEGRPKKLPQNEGVKGETAKALAKEHGVSRATVERAGKFAVAAGWAQIAEIVARHRRERSTNDSDD
jgi:hypothetical protein